MFQEYPKALYEGGKQDGECVVVDDAEQEVVKRSEGFAMIGEAVDAGEPDANGDTVETLRAALDEAGIAYKKTYGIERLKALLPK
jgi:hypothetical protein